MSKLRCRCGYVMVAQTMDEEFLYDFIPQKILNELLDKWDDAGLKFTSDNFFDYYNKYRKDIYKCPSCGRILVASDKDPNVFDSYIKED